MVNETNPNFQPYLPYEIEINAYAITTAYFLRMFLFLQNESRKLFVLRIEMGLEFIVPFVHSVDLVVVVSLTRAL